MPIDSDIEWAMLLSEAKVQVRSKERLLPPTVKPAAIVMCQNGTSFVPFVVTHCRRQVLDDMTEEDFAAEGFAERDAFKNFWNMKNRQAFYSPHERVYVYHLTRLDMSRLDDPGIFEGVHRLVESLYPMNFE